MKKYLIILLCLVNGCLFQPNDCTVLITTTNPKLSYSFDCDYSNYLAWMEVLRAQNQDNHNFGECKIKVRYDNNNNNILISGQTSKVGYSEEDAIDLKCYKIRFEKLKKEMGLNGDVFIWDKINIQVSCKKN